ncbi:MAG: DUF2905 domain-containing protein [Dehalococcoidia bacterium]|nr:DUF2905 domain-containing protein [Dehalococcoidia bacterium]MDD5494965.1 DUF2905 domain-containing protein [Dehalococcoidia bacterium]
MLIIIGGIILIAGIILIISPHIPFLGKLPGDIFIKKENYSFYFPLVTFLILSIVLTIIINVILYFLNK